jgi:hypothetical protein
MPDKPRWEKSTKRFFRKNTGEYNAVIFGATPPITMWAWGVYSTKRSDVGITHSLAGAKFEADSIIAKLGVSDAG